MFFFFKQKAESELRISDWSSDVCSSDLPPRRGRRATRRRAHPRLFRREARMSQHPGLAAWHAYMAGGGDPRALRDLLAEDAVFHSPVVHTPQEGRDKVFAYLHAASHVLGGDDFRYLREIVDGDQAVLEFQRSEEHTSELQSLLRLSYAVFCSI